MRILFLSPYVPLPVRHGGHNRTLGLVRCLGRFASVHVLAVGDPLDEGVARARAELASAGATLEAHPATGPGPEESDGADVVRRPDAAAHFRSPGLRAGLLACLAREPPDVVHVEELVMAQYLPDLPRPRVIDRQKVEWAYGEAMAEHDAAGGAALRREAARFRRWDESLAGAFEAVLVTGEPDRALLEPLHTGRVRVVPLGVDDRLRRRPDRTRSVDHVLLYGSLDYPPNDDANRAYFREVWPALREAEPALGTVVAGSGSPAAGSVPDDPRVDLRGFVPDLEPMLSAPGALVVPLRVGGGSRTRVLEALASGMPVVSTATGVEGLGLEPGRHYLPAESPSEFVAAVRRLARDPALVEALGREGAAHVETGFRWSAIGARLEPLYGELARLHPRVPAPAAGGGEAARVRPAGRVRALLVGVSPLPRQGDRRALSFPGHRTEQFESALAAAGCEVRGVLLDEEGEGAGGDPPAEGWQVVSPEAFRAGRVLQGVHDAFAPDIVVSAGGFHAARVVAHLQTDRPRWIDLPGDLAAEGQLRAAAGGDGVLADYLGVLERALARGDRFSVVGPSQRLAVLGQLGLAGRLSADRVGQEPVSVVPLACRGPAEPPRLPGEGFRALWAGGYNTWMDGTTLFDGLEAVMARRPEVSFVSMGGPVSGHAEEAHREFWERVGTSPHAGRYLDCGRLSRQEALRVLGTCHVVLCLSRRSLEVELGSRQRVVEAFAHGRPVVVTALGDLARDVAESDAGILVAPGDASGLASALLGLAEDRGALARAASRARDFWQRRWTYEATGSALAQWAAAPSRWPPAALADGSALREERFRLQSELDAIRSSYTFRALRLLDRLLGRGRPGS